MCNCIPINVNLQEGDEEGTSSYSDTLGASMSTIFSSPHSSVRLNHDSKLQVATLCYVYSKDILQASPTSELDLLQEPEMTMEEDRSKIKLQSISSPSVDKLDDIDKPSPSSNVVGVVCDRHTPQLGWSLIPSQAKAQLLSTSEEEVSGSSNCKLQSGWPPSSVDKSKQQPSQSSSRRKNKSKFQKPPSRSHTAWDRNARTCAGSLYHSTAQTELLPSQSLDFLKSVKEDSQEAPFYTSSMVRTVLSEA